MPSGDRRPASLAAVPLRALCLFLSFPAAAVESGARTIALVDFAVRALLRDAKVEGAAEEESRAVDPLIGLRQDVAAPSRERTMAAQALRAITGEDPGRDPTAWDDGARAHEKRQ